MTQIPYGKQWLDEEDIAAVVDVLRGDWLTTGPKVAELEKTVAELVHAKEAVAVSSGTAGLHAAMYALGIGPGDEVIVPAMTFAASANCVVYQGGTPVFADVEPDTLLIDPKDVEEKITSRTRAIIAVDYAGQPCDYKALSALAEKYHLCLVADACHSLGATYQGKPAGSLAMLTVFSFHPVKHITTGEGGLVTTKDPELARRLRLFRNHGITTDHRQRERTGSWFYEMVDLGFNYRITDIQCALGLSQLRKLASWVNRRREIAATYDKAFSTYPDLNPLAVRSQVGHAYHLYVVQLGVTLDRNWLFSDLRARGIGSNIHYIPVHLHPYYKRHFGTRTGLCPNAESAYRRIISLPMFPRLTAAEVQRVIETIHEAIALQQSGPQKIVA